VSRLLQDPSLLEEIFNKDIFGYLDSARGDSKTGGVSLLDIDDADIIWNEEEILEPEKPTFAPSMPKEKQTWPALATSIATLDVGNSKMEELGA
jgi:hypothetical protein